MAAGVVMGRLMLEPYFTKPADALANGVTIFVASYGLSPAEFQVDLSLGNSARALLVFFATGLVVVAALAMTFRQWRPETREATITYQAATAVGSASFAYTVFVFVTTAVVFAHEPAHILALQWAWLVMVAAEPIENVLRRIARPPKLSGGRIESLEDPGLVVARFPSGSKLNLGDGVTLGDPSVVGHIVEITSIIGEPRARISVSGSSAMRMGSEVTVGGLSGESVLGHVGEHTDLESMVLEVVPRASAKGLREERLLEVEIGAQMVLYQVLTSEVMDDSTKDYVRTILRVTARKLGTWSPAGRYFQSVAWLPKPDATVTLVPESAATFAPEAIGHVPGTNLGPSIDLHAAVTHNTAILGILGVGKTTLAWELMRRMAAEDIQVVALDISGRYVPEFKDALVDDDVAIATKINKAIGPFATDNNYVDGEAGNIAKFRAAMHSLFKKALSDKRKLLVLNPNDFEVTRIEGFPKGKKADQLAPLSAVEITRVIAEELLRVCQEKDPERSDEERKEQRARVCLLLEEAHSLVPEFSSTTSKAEEHAVAGTARALLQGRKYGLGAIVITQRTANVTKTILNQCNTLFAMRVFDQTGIEFLNNYIGPSYAKLLSTLQDWHAVYFGKATKSRAPVVIALNRDDDVRAHWPVEKPETNASIAEVTTEAPAPSTVDDDIPF